MPSEAALLSMMIAQSGGILACSMNGNSTEIEQRIGSGSPIAVMMAASLPKFPHRGHGHLCGAGLEVLAASRPVHVTLPARRACGQEEKGALHII
ncbi:hypothetical protein FAZ69_04850 [Trinickia terrae]|uniref:Uncharacterized protein n=1 Tax=Trinickia terrae TaxID=2571161 RepID=A0A4U1IDP2_9BURK|nr:hypothetical protein [Trinickia terrae]TKC91772.1 hypothetical protein FAZ69_04850 [Trinickia terrae]